MFNKKAQILFNYMVWCEGSFCRGSVLIWECFGISMFGTAIYNMQWWRLPGWLVVDQVAWPICDLCDTAPIYLLSYDIIYRLFLLHEIVLRFLKTYGWYQFQPGRGLVYVCAFSLPCSIVNSCLDEFSGTRFFLQSTCTLLRLIVQCTNGSQEDPMRWHCLTGSAIWPIPWSPV